MVRRQSQIFGTTFRERSSLTVVGFWASRGPVECSEVYWAGAGVGQVRPRGSLGPEIYVPASKSNRKRRVHYERRPDHNRTNPLGGACVLPWHTSVAAATCKGVRQPTARPDRFFIGRAPEEQLSFGSANPARRCRAYVKWDTPNRIQEDQRQGKVGDFLGGRAVGRTRGG